MGSIGPERVAGAVLSKKKPKKKPLGLGASGPVSAPVPQPSPTPAPRYAPGSKSAQIETDIGNIDKGYYQATNNHPSPTLVLELMGSGGTSSDYYQMFKDVTWNAQTRVDMLSEAHSRQMLDDSIAANQTPKELWGDFVAPGQPHVDLPTGAAVFSWSPFAYIGPGAKSWLDEQKRLNTEWPAPQPVAELLSGLSGGREDSFRKIMVEDLGFTEESGTQEMAKRYVFGAYLVPALDGDEEAAQRLRETGYIPEGMDVREWVDTNFSGTDEKRNQQIMQAAALGRDPRQSQSDWLANFSDSDYAPQSIKDEFDTTISKGLMDAAFMAMGDLTGVAQGLSLTQQGAQAAENAAQTEQGIDRTALKAAAAASSILNKVFTAPMYLERAAGATGAAALTATMQEADVEGVRRIGKAVVFSLAANEDIDMWHSAKVAIDNFAKTWKSNNGEMAAWQWAKAAGMDTSNEWIAAGCLFGELVFQGMLGRGMDAMTRGAVRAGRNSGLIKAEEAKMGVLSPEQIWSRTENPFVIRHTAQNSGVLMRAKDASHLAKVTSPELIREYANTSDSIVHLGREIDFGTPSLATHRRYGELMDTSRSPRQRMWRLPMKDQTLDLGEALNPDEGVYNYTIYHDLPLDRALGLAGEMTHALAKNHPDGLSPLQVAEKADNEVIAAYKAKPASRAYIKKTGNENATRYDEVISEQNKRNPKSEAQAQSSYLSNVRGQTNPNIRPDAIWSRESIALLKSAEKEYRKQIHDLSAEKTAARQARLAESGIEPVQAKPAMKTSEGGYKTRVVDIGAEDATIPAEGGVKQPIYRETDADGLVDFVYGRAGEPSGLGGAQVLHFTPDRNLALGQGSNRGILVEFEGAGLNLRSSSTKPGSAMTSPDLIHDTTTLSQKTGTTFRDAIRSITIKADAKLDKANQLRLKQIFAGKFDANVGGNTRGLPWGRVKNADGSTTFYPPRAKSPSTLPVDAGIAPHVSALNKAGYKTFGSHSSLKGDHPKGHPSRDLPGYIEFEADNPAIRSAAEKHGLEVEETSGGGAAPQSNRTLVRDTFEPYGYRSTGSKSAVGQKIAHLDEAWRADPTKEKFEAARSAIIAEHEKRLKQTRERLAKNPEGTYQPQIDRAEGQIADLRALKYEDEVAGGTPPAAQSASRLLVRNPLSGAQAQSLWRKFTNDLLDEAIPANEAEGALTERIATAEASRQRLIDTAQGSVEKKTGPTTDKELKNHYNWKLDQRTGALVNSGLHRNPISAEEMTWERNLSVADGANLTPWFDLVNGLVPELLDTPLPLVGSGVWGGLRGKSGLSSLDTVQEHGINQVTKARKMIALAKLSTIAIIIGADEFVRSAIWAVGATGSNPKVLAGIISRRLEERGFTGVTEDINNLFESSPEFRDQFLPSLLQDKKKVTWLDVDPGDPKFTAAAKQEVATFNATNGLTGSQVCRDWYRGLQEGEAKFGVNDPKAYDHARDLFFRLISEDPYYVKEGNPGYELMHMRNVSPYAKNVLRIPSLVENWAEGIDLAARARCQNPVTRRHFTEGPSSVRKTDFKDPSVAQVYGPTSGAFDMAVARPNAWQRIRVNPAPGANIANRAGAGVVNTVVHPINALFEVLGGAGTRLKRESFAAFYKDALKNIEQQRPRITPEDAAYEAMNVAFSKTKSISYMAEHAFLEDQLRNVILFLPAYKQFAQFWGKKAVQNVWMTSIVLNDLLNHKDEINKAAGGVLDKTLGAIPGVKGMIKALPVETTFFDVTDREGNLALRNILPPINIVAQDILGLASTQSKSARSVYETISGGYAPNAPIHGPAEALVWSMLPESIRQRYEEATGGLEGTANLVDNRTKRTVLNMARQYAAGQTIDYEKAIGESNPFDLNKEFPFVLSTGGTRGFERGLAFTKFTIPVRTQKLYGTMKVAPKMNNGKPLTIDLDRLNEGQRQYLSAEDDQSRSLVLEMFPEYKPVAQAYNLEGNKQLEYLAQHRWVIPFVVLSTTPDDHYSGPTPVTFAEKQAARRKIGASEMASSIQGRVNQVDRFLLARRYAPQAGLIDADPLKALAAYVAWKKNKRVGRQSENPLPDVDATSIQAAQDIVDSFKGERVSEAAVTQAMHVLVAGLDTEFNQKHGKTLDRVTTDRQHWQSEMTLADGGHAPGWKNIYPGLTRLWDTGEAWAQQLVRDSKFYGDFIAQKNDDAQAKKKNATFFALLGNKAKWITATENEQQVFEVLRSIGFTGKDKVLRAQVVDMLPYIEQVDKANAQIAKSFEKRGDDYSAAVLQRDVQLEALRQRYPELKFSTAQWMHELGYDEFRFTHPDYPGLMEAQGAKALSPTTLKQIQQWSRQMVRVNTFNALTFPTAASQAESLQQWRGYLGKWKKAYSSVDPQTRPALDELSRANAWWVMWGVAEGVRKQMLEKDVSTGSKMGKAIVGYLDTIYSDMRTASPTFASEVDEVFGKKDFIKYMIDPRRETSPDLKAVKEGAKKLQNADSVVSYAQTLLGVPSKSYGPYGPDTGMSCSAFTAYVMSRFGVEMDAFTGDQDTHGTPVTGSNTQRGDASQLLPGDLVFKVTGNSEFTDKKGFGHVALYIGNGRIIEANNGPSVAYGNLSSWTGAWQGRRYLKGVR